MANRDFKPVRGANRELVLIAGYFTTDGAGAVSTQVPSGTLAKQGAFTVTKPAGTGIYQVQCDGYNDILHADANVWANAGTLNSDIQPITPITPSGGAVQFQCRKTSDGTAQDAISTRISFVIFAKNSAVAP
jgi:hypothetical protein